MTTPAQPGAEARRLVLRLDARDAAGRLTAALRRRGVFVRPDPTDAMAVLSALLTVPEAEALLDALGRHADALDDDPDDRRTRGQKMADCLLDLVLRPGGNDLPPVPAEMVRALARALGLLPSPADARTPAPRTETAEAQAEIEATTEAELRALEDWWAAVEERAPAGEWRGAEAPPWEEQLRFWAEEAAWDEEHCSDDGADPDQDQGDVSPDRTADGPCAPAADAAPDPGSWASADRAVDAAGGVLLDLDRALGRATSAVRAAGAADAADEEAHEGRPSTAADALTALASATAEQRAVIADLLDRTGGGGLVDRPRIAVVDALGGALLALTGSRGLRQGAHCGARACRRDPGRCTHDLSGRTGLGPPLATPAHRAGAELDRFLRARDRRCRFPGCRAPVPRGGGLDHDRRWPDGPTDAANLAGYCTPHHRGKHQAPGWLHDLAPDGTLTVTTPTGLVARTTPPPY